MGKTRWGAVAAEDRRGQFILTVVTVRAQICGPSWPPARRRADRRSRLSISRPWRRRLRSTAELTPSSSGLGLLCLRRTMCTATRSTCFQSQVPLWAPYRNPVPTDRRPLTMDWRCRPPSSRLTSCLTPSLSQRSVPSRSRTHKMSAHVSAADGDTGNNMVISLKSAVVALGPEPPADLCAVAKIIAAQTALASGSTVAVAAADIACTTHRRRWRLAYQHRHRCASSRAASDHVSVWAGG